MTAGRPDSKEREERPFRRAECVRHSVSTFVPPPFLLLKEEIESRYLKDVYVRPGGRFLRSRSLDAAVTERIEGLGDPGTALTDGELSDLGEQENQARRSWGPAVVARAREFELVETLTPGQAKDRLALAPYVDLAESARRESGGFRYSGWEVFSAPDGQPVLLVPTAHDGQTFFETVGLDDLHRLDPEFLPGLIRECEEKAVMSVLANSVIYDLGLHQAPELGLFPGCVIRVAQIEDPEQRAGEIQSMRAFMERMVGLGDDYASSVDRFERELLSGECDMGNGRRAYSDFYLKHMVGCPTRTTEARQPVFYFGSSHPSCLSN